MSGQKVLGVVVIGLGIAGKVRVRDLKEGATGFKLKGVVSRRPVEIKDVSSLTLDEALNNQEVDAVIVCTENALHEDYIRKGLEHGKHVLVEYPIALTSESAKSLYQLAEDKGLVLHEENIALLTESFSVIKVKSEQVELRSASYSLKGSYNGWIEHFEKSGLPFISSISGIQTFVALFGDLVVDGAKFNKTEDGYEALADLKTLNGKLIKMSLSRSSLSGVKRQKSAVYIFEDGEVIDAEKVPNSSQSKPGLFMQDLLNFKQIIEGSLSSAENKHVTLRSLEIAEKIHSFFSPEDIN